MDIVLILVLFSPKIHLLYALFGLLKAHPKTTEAATSIKMPNGSDRLNREAEMHHMLRIFFRL